MNERINQLLGQAYDEAVPETWTTLSSEQLGRVYNKFAELIVQECATVIEKNLFQNIGYNTSRAVKRHFGMEDEE